MIKKADAAEIRRQQLIDVAKILFLEKGYDNVTIKDILEEVNGPRGMFYYYFKDKEAIYKIVIDQLVEELLKQRLRCFEETNLTFIEKTDALVNQVIFQYEQIWTSINDKVNLDYERDIALKMMDELSRHISIYLRDAIRSNEIEESDFLSLENCDQMMRFIVFGFNGVMDDKAVKTNMEKMRECGRLIQCYVRRLLVNS